MSTTPTPSAPMAVWQAPPATAPSPARRPPTSVQVLLHTDLATAREELFDAIGLFAPQ
ncbi:hypothetical protein [Acidovorax sp.]|uniref:hypothetical protein n=1 Tax=Acidovorax sp. TaxID=1872122 RepID=UPI00391F46BC